ncbi:kelch repeat-containing protein [Puia dinghuensis]|uniref:Galactose oxidase n=1 Tax=Puia dinghuensis TaxID=1792502 RepID=A0A8J2U791_9BACT|nr:hypothetical protein [Puia dinghuensis]GGA83384.1 hypothetical protein GCM10011511_03060 [Puia dinghuensis]
MLVTVPKTILPFILCLPILTANAQGLQFKSEDSLLTQRTSYRVFPSAAPVFQDHFFIRFDLSLWDNANLGYVFNLADKDLSYSLSYLYNNGQGNLNFNIDRKSNKLSIPLPASLLKKRNWFTVTLDLDLKGDKAVIRIDNLLYRVDSLGFKPGMAANLVFGKNQYYTEVPNMAIRNLEVGDGHQHYFFPLNEWSGNSVHDSNGEVTGFVENPLWLINESYFWKPVYVQSDTAVAGLNFNPLGEKLFIFTRDSLITYDPAGKRAKAAAYVNKLPVAMVLGKSIFNTRENKCYIYELFDIPKGAPTIAALHMDSAHLKWDVVGRDALPYQLHHHNIFYDWRHDRFYLFGGYGHYSYHNGFLSYNDSIDKWERVTFTGDTITPRFFAATGPSDKADELLLFGGYGNESGNQVVGGKQYYDLYRINLRDHSVKKCWQIVPAGEVFVPANNLILSKDKRYFYALCYPHELAKTELKLYKFSLRDGSYEVVSAPISMASMRIETDVNLFYSQKTDEFFCTVQEFTDRHHSVIKVYSLTSPPVSAAVYFASLQPRKKPGVALLFWLLPVLIGVAGAIWFFFVRKRKQPESAPEEEQEAAPVSFAGENRNAVYLLGEFLVFDRKGSDITHLFSPKIKQLFVLILLNSVDGKGIGSRKISARLWPEKDPAKTKNIKGVTFNHLRNIISDIDGIELIFLNDSYSFAFGESFFCDYRLLSTLILGEGTILNHLPLMARGPLLEDMPDSLLDDFKSAYEDRLTTILLPELKRAYESQHLKEALEIAKLILGMDPFNEEVLKYQLKCFRRLKGIEYSRRAYDRFSQDYERSLGVAYHVSFDKIVH